MFREKQDSFQPHYSHITFMRGLGISPRESPVRGPSSLGVIHKYSLCKESVAQSIVPKMLKVTKNNGEDKQIKLHIQVELGDSIKIMPSAQNDEPLLSPSFYLLDKRKVELPSTQEPIDNLF